MRGTLKYLVLILAFSGLVGCAGLELENARDMGPGGKDFAGDLYRGYVEISSAEFDEGDYRDSDTFARRAMEATGGNPPAPEALAARALPKESMPELSNARGRLVTMMTPEVAQAMPYDLARAQVMFDCWMQEQEENFQPEDIAKCRAAFLDHMGKIEAAMMKPMPAPMPKKVEKPKPVEQYFVVFFGNDSAALDDRANAVIARAVAAAKAVSGSRMSVTGHTDRVGSMVYNRRLSEKRAKAVAEAIAASGIAGNRVVVGSMGEEDAAVRTPDEVSEQSNRRVEILLRP